MGLLDPLKTVFFSDRKKPKEATEAKKAHFSLEGANADGDYVFVSKEGVPGRGILTYDGSFYFMSMPDPDDKEALDENDRRDFFSARFFAGRDELEAVMRSLEEASKDVKKLEEEVEKVKEQKKNLEEERELLRKENDKLSAAARTGLEVERKEEPMRMNPVTAESVAEAAGSGLPPEEGMEALEEARKIFLDYQVTDADEESEEQIAEILSSSFARYVPKTQEAMIADLFMQGAKEADTETYLRLAAFAGAVGAITAGKEVAARCPNRKDVNRAFMNDVADILRSWEGDAEYGLLTVEEKVAELRRQIEPTLESYPERVEAAMAQAQQA